MSQENVEIVCKSVQAFLDTEWRMVGPVEEAFEALGLSEHDAHADS